MWQWLRDNLATIVISLILFAARAAIAVKVIKDKKQGKSSCGAGCKSCALCGKCHGGCASPEERQRMMEEAKQRLAAKEAARKAAKEAAEAAEKTAEKETAEAAEKAAKKTAEVQADLSREKSADSGAEK